MARPNKTGLDYFPFDIDFFDDEKIIAISGEFGIKGEITVIKLLCAIYRNGYFILWNDLLKFKLLKNLPGISSELIESIVNRLVLWEFFDKALFDSVKVLTSKGIQKRYFEAVKRRKSDDNLPYLLVNVCNNEINVYNNPISDNINVGKNTTKKSKVNKKEISPEGDTKNNAPDGASLLPELSDTSEVELSVCRQRMLADTYWIETFCMNNSISIEQFNKAIDIFFKTLQNRGEIRKSAKDAKFHFSSWLNLELQKQNKNGRNKNFTTASNSYHAAAGYGEE